MSAVVAQTQLGDDGAIEHQLARQADDVAGRLSSLGQGTIVKPKDALVCLTAVAVVYPLLTLKDCCKR